MPEFIELEVSGTSNITAIGFMGDKFRANFSEWCFKTEIDESEIGDIYVNGGSKIYNRGSVSVRGK